MIPDRSRNHMHAGSMVGFTSEENDDSSHASPLATDLIGANSSQHYCLACVGGQAGSPMQEEDAMITMHGELLLMDWIGAAIYYY